MQLHFFLQFFHFSTSLACIIMFFPFLYPFLTPYGPSWHYQSLPIYWLLIPSMVLSHKIQPLSFFFGSWVPLPRLVPRADVTIQLYFAVIHLWAASVPYMVTKTFDRPWLSVASPDLNRDFKPMACQCYSSCWMGFQEPKNLLKWNIHHFYQLLKGVYFP